MNEDGSFAEWKMRWFSAECMAGWLAGMVWYGMVA